MTATRMRRRLLRTSRILIVTANYYLGDENVVSATDLSNGICALLAPGWAP
jgi:hypothetical protein